LASEPPILLGPCLAPADPQPLPDPAQIRRAIKRTPSPVPQKPPAQEVAAGMNALILTMPTPALGGDRARRSREPRTIDQLKALSGSPTKRGLSGTVRCERSCSSSSCRERRNMECIKPDLSCPANSETVDDLARRIRPPVLSRLNSRNRPKIERL